MYELAESYAEYIRRLLGCQDRQPGRIADEYAPPWNKVTCRIGVGVPYHDACDH